MGKLLFRNREDIPCNEQAYFAISYSNDPQSPGDFDRQRGVRNLSHVSNVLPQSYCKDVSINLTGLTTLMPLQPPDQLPMPMRQSALLNAVLSTAAAQLYHKLPDKAFRGRQRQNLAFSGSMQHIAPVRLRRHWFVFLALGFVGWIQAREKFLRIGDLA